jgi:hypothetical protein
VVIARSGDLGLSVGPAAVNGKRGGYYATIWRKGPDGAWKWIYDGGAEADAASAPDASAPAIQGVTAAKGSRSPADALNAVRSAEAPWPRRPPATRPGPIAPPCRPTPG